MTRSFRDFVRNYNGASPVNTQCVEQRSLRTTVYGIRTLDNWSLYGVAADTFGGIIKTADSIEIVRPKDTQLLTHEIKPLAQAPAKVLLKTRVRPVFRFTAAKPEHVNADKATEENGKPAERVLAG